MRAGPVGAIVLMAMGLLGLEACGDCPCDDCPFSSAASELRAAPLPERSIRAVVSTESSGALVVTLTMTTAYACSVPTMASIYYRLDAATGRLEPSAEPPAAAARVRVATTTGGGTATYEDLAPGVTLRVASVPADASTEYQPGVELTLETATPPPQRIRCIVNYGAAPQCTAVSP